MLIRNMTICRLLELILLFKILNIMLNEADLDIGDL